MFSAGHGSDFSGWQDEELGTKSPAVGGVDIPGLRSGMISRLDTRGSQRRRGEGNGYQFTHLLEAHEHMEHYRTHCCYTMLACASPQSSLVVPDLVDQGQQALFKLEVKSLYRGGDPFLRELASRLGVGDSIREPQLLTPHRQTAPSIVKRPCNKTDLVIDLTPKPRYTDVTTTMLYTQLSLSYSASVLVLLIRGTHAQLRLQQSVCHHVCLSVCLGKHATVILSLSNF